MEFNDILQAISTVGFPIVCCGALMWLNYKKDKEHATEMHYVNENVTEALNNNTMAINKITMLMEVREKQ